MASIAKQGRRHRAVYWARLGSNANAVPIVASPPTELKVRWDDSRAEVLGPNGQPIRIDATVSGFDFEPAVGAAMWKGRIADLPGTAQVPNSNVMVIVKVNSVPLVKNRNKFVTAYLMRSKAVLG